MTPLAEIGWFRHHISALWWLGLLYRRPNQFIAELEKDRTGSLWGRFVSVFRLYLHLLPYAVLTITTGRLLFKDTGQQCLSNSASASPSWLILVLVLAMSIAGGYLAGFAGGFRTGKPRISSSEFAITFLFWPASLAIAFIEVHGISSSARDLTIGCAGGCTLGLVAGILGGACGKRFNIECIVVGVTTGATIAAVATWLGGESAHLAVVGLAYSISSVVVVTRAYYQVLFLFLSWPWPMARLYRLHPVAWDDLCGLPFPNLSGLLVAYGEREPQAVDRELARLERDCPPQRRSALRARTILIARRSAEMKGFGEIDPLLAGLCEGERGYLRQTKILRERASALAAQASRVETTTVPVLKAAEATQLCLKVREFRDQIAGFEEPLVSEFQEAARHWLKLAEQLQAQAQGLGERVTWPQVFQAGNRIEDRNREAFVRRDAVLDDLRQQLLLATGCPGILLYGRRRVGKSTVLTNLAGFLPDSVSVAFVSMQNPNLFQSLASFCQALGRAASQALPPSLRTTGAEPSTLVSLWDMLHRLNETLGKEERQLLLAIDEYENLDQKIGEGMFSTDLLSGLRESLQSHRQIIWLFAGSHAVEELVHAPWASCFVSSRTVEVGMFTSDETYVLLTDPMRHAPRALSAAAPNIHFPPESWGPRGIERIHREAGGWPHLVQLIAETLTDVVNRTGQDVVNEKLFEEALGKAIVRGDAVFVELLRKECRSSAEWEYIAGFRTKDAQPAPPEDVLGPLRRRWLLEPDGEMWRLRVPLMQRWLRVRG